MKDSKPAPIDFGEIAKVLWGRWRFIVRVCAVVLVIAIIYAYSKPRGYSASVVLAPEATGSSLMGGMSALAAAAGVNLKDNTEDAIYPEIYPDLMGSPQFLVGLFDVRVKSADGVVDTTLFAYYTKYQKHPWWDYGFIALRKVKTALFGKPNNGRSGDGVDAFWLSETQNDVCQMIKGDMSCSVDRKTGVITIGFSAQDPLIAATMTDSLKEKLQTFIVQYRTCKARVDLEYFMKLSEETRSDYVRAQQRYASFCDRNNEIFLQSYIVEKERLSNEVELAQQAYSQMMQQVQMAQAKVQEQTPAFTVVSGATVPLKPSSPKRLFIMVGSLFLGGLGASVYVYLKARFGGALKKDD